MLYDWFPKVLRALGPPRQNRHSRGQPRPRRAPLALEPLEDRLAPATLTWVGDVDANWNTNVAGNTNWSGNVLPASGDTLVFNGAAPGTLNNNTAVGNTYALQITAGGYTFNGNRITLNQTATGTPFAIRYTGAGFTQVNTALALGAAINTIEATGDLGLIGVISGPVGNALVKTGNNQLGLHNSGNSYDGQTIVNAGALLAIADRSLGSTVRGTVVNSGGTLALQAVNYTTAEPLELNGDGGVFGGALETISGPSTFAGNISLGSSSSYLGAFNLTLTGTVNSLGSPRDLTLFSFGGPQAVTFQGAVGNTLAINSITQAAGMGPVTFRQNVTLGTGTSTFNENVVLDGVLTFTAGGNVTFGNAGTDTLTISSAPTLDIAGTRTITVNAATTLNGPLFIQGPGDINIGGVVSGIGSLIQNGPGTLTLSNNANSYINTTRLNGGALVIGANNALGTSFLVLSAGDVEAGGGPRTLPSANNVTLDGNVTFVGSNDLTFNGPATLTGNRTLTVVNAGLTAFANGIRQDGAGRGLLKNGSGTLVLAGTSTYTGTTTVTAGTLLINGSLVSATTVNAATLGGTGTTAAVTVNNGGSLAPGVSGPGTLQTGPLGLTTGATFRVELGGTDPANYDRVAVSGSVNLGNATLAVSTEGGFMPSGATQQTFTIIDKVTPGLVTGTFLNLPEGSAVTVAGSAVPLFITYRGGDGNDVQLTSQKVVNGTNGNDRLILRQVAGDPSRIEYNLNDAGFVPVSSLVTFTFNGLAGNDTMIVDFVNGDPISAGGVFYNGDDPVASSPGDLLVVRGSGTQSAIYTPAAAPRGDGSVTVTGAGVITFTGLEPVDMTGFNRVTLTLPRADDVIDLSDGTAASDAGQPALVITGTSGGVAFESLRLFGNTFVVIDTTTNDGADTITIISASNRVNTNLIILTGAGNDTVTVAPGAAVGFNGFLVIESPRIHLNTANAITTGGLQTYDGSVHLGADTILTSLGGGPIAFTSTVNGPAGLTVNTTGTTTFGGAMGGTTALASLTTNVGGTTALNAGSVTTTGAQTYGDAVTLGANTVLTSGGGAIFFASTVDGAFSLTVNTAGTTTFGGGVGVTTNLASLTTNAGGSTALNGGSVRTAGAQSYGDAVTLGVNTGLESAGGAIFFSSTVDGAFRLSVLAGTTTFGGAVGGSAALANLEVFGGITALNGGSVSTTGDQIYDVAVTLGANTVLTSTASGLIFLLFTVDGAFSLTVNTAGTTFFRGDLGSSTALNSLTTNAGGTTSFGGANVTTTGGQSYGDTVTLGFNAVLTSTDSGAISFASTVDGQRSLTINTSGATTFVRAVGGTTALASLTTNAEGSTVLNGGSVTTTGGQAYGDAVILGANTILTSTSAGAIFFASTVNGAFTLLVNTAGVTTFGGAVAVASLTTNAGGSTAFNGDSVTTTGAQTYNDAVTVGANTVLASTGGEAIAFAGTVDGPAALTVNTAGITSFAGVIGGSTALASLNTNAGGNTALNGGAVTTTGGQTYNDAVILGANTVLTATGGGAIAFAGTVNGAFRLTVNTAGITTFRGVVGGGTALASLTTNAGGSTALNGGSVTTTGAQTYNDAVILGVNSTVNSTSSGAIAFAGTVNGAFSLMVNTAGITTFGGGVGGSAALTSLTTDAGGSTALNGGSVRTTGAQTYNDAVTVGVNTVLASTGGAAIVFASTLNGPAALTVNTTGTTTFGGAVGGGTALASLTTNAGGSTALNGGSVVTTGGQTYNDAVILGANTVLAATGGGAIAFASTLNGAFNLTVNTAGVTTFRGVVGGTAALTSLTTNPGGSTALNGGSVRTTGAQTYNDAVTVGVNTVLASTGGGPITFASALNGPAALTVNTTGATTFGGVAGGGTALASLTTNAGGSTAINGGSVVTTGGQTYNDAVILGANTVLTSTGGGAIAFAGTVNGAFGLAVNTAGITTFGDAVGASTALASLTTNAGGSTALNGGSVTTTGGQTYGDAVVLGANTVLTSTGRGAISFAGPVDGAVSLAVNTAGPTTFGGAVGNSLPLTRLTTNAGGTATFGGGIVRVNGDSVSAFNDAVLLAANTTLVSTGTGGFAFAGNVDSTPGAARNLTVVTTNAAAALSFTGGTIGGSGPLGTLILDDAGPATLASVLAGAATHLQKEGAGILTLSSASTYGGTTTVNAGTLLVNGSIVSETIVNADAVLGGAGTINQRVVVVGTLAPGDPGGPGTLSVAEVLFDSRGRFELNNQATALDQLMASGSVSLNGALLDFTLNDSFAPMVGELFLIVDNEGTDPINGTFRGLPEGQTFDLNGFRFYITYLGGDGNDVALLRLTPTQSLVVALYHDLLERNADFFGLNYYTNFFTLGATTQGVVGFIWNTDEYIGKELREIYWQFLRRDLDPAGLQVWGPVARAQGGFAPVVAGIVVSPEYASQFSNAQFLVDLYTYVLKQPVDPADFAFWSQILANGARNRSEVALFFLGTNQAIGTALNDQYAQFLGRVPDPVGGPLFFNLAVTGQVNPRGLTVILAGSLEYFMKAQTDPLAPPPGLSN